MEIYDFISSDDESYVDPLSKVKEWSGGLMGSFGIQQGPARYIEHSSRYMVSDGKLYEL